MIPLHFPLKAVARSYQSSVSFPECQESPEQDVGPVSHKDSYLKGSFVIRLTITEVSIMVAAAAVPIVILYCFHEIKIISENMQVTITMSLC